jgi:rubrerythrin
MSVSNHLSELLNEAIVTKNVIRDGKPTKVQTTNRDGYKIVGGREVKMTLAEKMARNKSTSKSQAAKSSTQIATEKQKGKEGQDQRADTIDRSQEQFVIKCKKCGTIIYDPKVSPRKYRYEICQKCQGN